MSKRRCLVSWTQVWSKPGTQGRVKADMSRHGGKLEVGKLGLGRRELPPSSVGLRGRQHLVRILCPTESWRIVSVVETQLWEQG